MQTVARAKAYIPDQLVSVDKDITNLESTYGIWWVPSVLLEKYFFPVGEIFFPKWEKNRAMRNLQTCKTCSPPHTHARAYNKVNFDF